MANKCVVKGCVVKGCPNKTDEGHFVGDICGACYAHITTGRVGPTQSFLKCIPQMRRNLLRVKRLASMPCELLADLIMVELMDVEDDGK